MATAQDFFGALRASTYDNQIRDWIVDEIVGGWGAHLTHPAQPGPVPLAPAPRASYSSRKGGSVRGTSHIRAPKGEP